MIFKKIIYKLKMLYIKLIYSTKTNRIKKIKNIYNNKRCFIIGNGPSLKIEDLELLKDDFCFGSHKIYDIFDRTSWRPSFYVAQDSKLIIDSVNDIIKNTKYVKYRFLPINLWSNYPNLLKKSKNSIFFNFKIEDFYPDLPKFSSELDKQLFEGMTVTYACFQLAVYMGFKDIYLLGVDHNYSINKDINGNIIKNDVNDYFEGSDKNLDITKYNVPQLGKSTLAYESAKQFCEKHNIRVYNVTRGGKLEVFKRKNFDDIIQKRGN